MNMRSFSGTLLSHLKIGNGDAEVIVSTGVDDDEIMEHAVFLSSGAEITDALGDEAFALIEAHIMRNWQSLTSAAVHEREYDMAGDA